LVLDYSESEWLDIPSEEASGTVKSSKCAGQEMLQNCDAWPGNIHLCNVTFFFAVLVILPYIAYPAPHSLIKCHILFCNQMVA